MLMKMPDEVLLPRVEQGGLYSTTSQSLAIKARLAGTRWEIMAMEPFLGALRSAMGPDWVGLPISIVEMQSKGKGKGKEKGKSKRKG